jgi:AcrR family transcriptional regulator
VSRVDDTAADALPTRTARAEQTRALILDTALHMFRESGYEATTMRAIAQKAGVATGNAYYYFASKDELMGEFYARLVTEQASASRGVLETETALAARLEGVLRALIDVQAPYHAFGATLCSRATVPSPARAQAMALYTEVVTGARTRVPPHLRDRLPEILWLAATGVCWFWTHDRSPEFRRTYRLIEAVAPLAERLVRLSRLPVLRAFTRQLTATLDAVHR